MRGETLVEDMRVTWPNSGNLETQLAWHLQATARLQMSLPFLAALSQADPHSEVTANVNML